jgi:hypothetical protein
VLAFDSGSEIAAGTAHVSGSFVANANGGGGGANGMSSASAGQMSPPMFHHVVHHPHPHGGGNYPLHSGYHHHHQHQAHLLNNSMSPNYRFARSPSVSGYIPPVAASMYTFGTPVPGAAVPVAGEGAGDIGTGAAQAGALTASDDGSNAGLLAFGPPAHHNGGFTSGGGSSSLAAARSVVAAAVQHHLGGVMSDCSLEQWPSLSGGPGLFTGSDAVSGVVFAGGRRVSLGAGAGAVVSVSPTGPLAGQFPLAAHAGPAVGFGAGYAGGGRGIAGGVLYESPTTSQPIAHPATAAIPPIALSMALSSPAAAAAPVVPADDSAFLATPINATTPPAVTDAVHQCLPACNPSSARDELHHQHQPFADTVTSRGSADRATVRGVDLGAHNDDASFSGTAAGLVVPVLATRELLAADSSMMNAAGAGAHAASGHASRSTTPRGGGMGASLGGCSAGAAGSVPTPRGVDGGSFAGRRGETHGPSYHGCSALAAAAAAVGGGDAPSCASAPATARPSSAAARSPLGTPRRARSDSVARGETHGVSYHAPHSHPHAHHPVVHADPPM